MTNRVRFTAICLGLAAQIICCHADDFYVAKKNIVYITSARKLPWKDTSLIPLALREYRHQVRVLVVYQKNLRKITEIDFSQLPNFFRIPDLDFDSLMVSEGNVFQKVGQLRFFKQYPTDAYDRNVNVTAVPRHNRIFVTVAPTQKNGFEGSTCIVTDINTKQDVHVAHRISEVYTNFQNVMTWVSDRTVLAFEYTWHESGGYYIDTQIDTRTDGYSAMNGACYFSFDGSELTLYTPHGDHFDTRVATNFSDTLKPAGFLLFSQDAAYHSNDLVFQPLN